MPLRVDLVKSVKHGFCAKKLDTAAPPYPPLTSFDTTRILLVLDQPLISCHPLVVLTAGVCESHDTSKVNKYLMLSVGK